MLSLKEITLIDPDQVNPEKLKQCIDLQTRINIIRAAWGKPMISTSGVRTWLDHVRIYKGLAVKNLYPFTDGLFDEAKIPSRSKHLETVTDSAAVDILDLGQKLKRWLKDTPEGQRALEEANLFCEDDEVERLHFQNKPFASYKPGASRWFKP